MNLPIFFILGYFLRRAHWLSLDVVLGAVLAHVVAQKLPDGRGEISWISTLLVAIAVFITYTIDRFLDNTKTTSPTTPRHQFYAKHQSLLTKIIIGLAVVGAILLFWLPKAILIFGLIMSALVGLYLWAVYQVSATSSLYAWKEIMVAVAYTAGVWGTSFVNKSLITNEMYILLVLLLLVAFQNLLLFSWFESFQIEAGNSFAITYGTDPTSRLITWITAIVIVAGFGVVLTTSYHYTVRSAIVLIMMSVATFLLKKNKESVTLHENYRWLADGILLWWIWLL